MLLNHSLTVLQILPHVSTFDVTTPADSISRHPESGSQCPHLPFPLTCIPVAGSTSTEHHLSCRVCRCGVHSKKVTLSKVKGNTHDSGVCVPPGVGTVKQGLFLSVFWAEKEPAKDAEVAQ